MFKNLKLYYFLTACLVTRIQANATPEQISQRAAELKIIVNQIAQNNGNRLITKESNENTKKIIIQLLKPYTKELIFKSILSVSQFYTWNKNSKLFGQLLKEGRSFKRTSDSKNPMKMAVGWLIGSYISSRAIEKTRNWNSKRLKAKIETEVTMVLLEYLKDQSQSFFNETSSSILSSSITTITASLPQLVDIIFEWATGFASEIPLAWKSIFDINPKLCIGTIFWQITSSIFSWKIATSDGKKIFNASNKQTEVTKELSDTLANISTIQSFNGNIFEKNRFSKFTQKYLDASADQRNTAITKEMLQELNVASYQIGVFSLALNKFLIIPVPTLIFLKKL